jgi:hypothetical protein
LRARRSVGGVHFVVRPRGGGQPGCRGGDGRWKLLVDRGGSRPELFDIEADPKEQTDLADQHASVVKALTDRVIAWDKETAR